MVREVGVPGPAPVGTARGRRARRGQSGLIPKICALRTGREGQAGGWSTLSHELAGAIFAIGEAEIRRAEFGRRRVSSEIPGRLSRVAPDSPPPSTPPLRERAAAAVIRELLDAVNAEVAGGPPSDVVRTGVEGIDGVTGGLRRGDVYLIVGAGDLAFDLGLHVAASVAMAGDEVVVRSRAATDRRIATRRICARAGVAEARWIARMMQEDEWRRVTRAASAIAGLPLWIGGVAGAADGSAEAPRSARLVGEDDPSTDRVAEIVARAASGDGAVIVTTRPEAGKIACHPATVWDVETVGEGEVEIAVRRNVHGPMGRLRLEHDGASGRVGAEVEAAEE